MNRTSAVDVSSQAVSPASISGIGSSSRFGWPRLQATEVSPRLPPCFVRVNSGVSLHHEVVDVCLDARELEEAADLTAGVHDADRAGPSQAHAGLDHSPETAAVHVRDPGQVERDVTGRPAQLVEELV